MAPPTHDVARHGLGPGGPLAARWWCRGSSRATSGSAPRASRSAPPRPGVTTSGRGRRRTGSRRSRGRAGRARPAAPRATARPGPRAPRRSRRGRRSPGLAGEKTQNSLPSGSASTVQRGCSHRYVAPRASRSSTRPTTSQCTRLGSVRGSGTGAKSRVIRSSTATPGQRPPVVLGLVRRLDPEELAPPAGLGLGIGAVDRRSRGSGTPATGPACARTHRTRCPPGRPSRSTRSRSPTAGASTRAPRAVRSSTEPQSTSRWTRFLTRCGRSTGLTHTVCRDVGPLAGPVARCRRPRAR